MAEKKRPEKNLISIKALKSEKGRKSEVHPDDPEFPDYPVRRLSDARECAMAETFGGGASPAAGGGGGGGAVSGSHLSHLSGEDSASAAMSMSAFGGGGHSLFGSWGQEEADPEGPPGGEYPEEGADGGQGKQCSVAKLHESHCPSFSVSSTTPFYPNAQFQFMESEEGGDPEMSAPDPGLPPPDLAMDPLKRAYSGRKTEYIEDRKSRYKSYHRRRPIPFKKVPKGIVILKRLYLTSFPLFFCSDPRPGRVLRHPHPAGADVRGL